MKNVALKKECLRRATLVADWLVAGQISDRESADRGRYIYMLPVRGEKARTHYTTNWTTGMTAISMLMAWRRTGKKEYIASVGTAIGYLKSLQCFDPRNKAAIGTFVEESPQSEGCHPRDALSAAWGFLQLHMAMGNHNDLWRAQLFADWFSKHAVKNNYPAWTFYTRPGKPPYWQLGSFHGGSPLFFFDLYTVTKQEKWKRLGLKICDRWIELFLKDDGSIRIEIDPDTGRDMTGTGPNTGHIGWQDMHKLNDDFTTLALMRAYKLTGRKHYREAATRYFDWVLSVQRPDGAFGAIPVNSGCASLIVELLDFAKLTGRKRYLEACMKSVPHFFSLQELKLKEPQFHGGFYCVDEVYTHNQKATLGARTSAYALAALLKLEGGMKYRGYTA
ncbi:MAG: hypothetical protein C0404_10605 [Verrucomicrobia bacterium]|nr:hypothetical protein [Verrucomicrobiota bacterium]